MNKSLITILVVLAFNGVAEATPVDSNSIIKDNIEYYFQTDKSVYDLGETVNMLYRVTNLGETNVMFKFNVGPVTDRCDFMIDKDGERIWDNLNRRKTLAETYFTLGTSGSRSFLLSWDMTDLGGNQILPGNYDVTGALGDLDPYYQDKYVPISVDIQVIPEPCSLLLISTGLVGILSYRRRKM